MHWWEVVLLFVGVPLLLCAVVTAVVFFFFTTPDRDSLRPGAGWSATSSSAEESGEPPAPTSELQETDPVATAATKGGSIDCHSPPDDAPEQQEQLP